MTEGNEIRNIVSNVLNTEATFALELLTFLLKAQTSDERRDQTTRHPNRQGFNVVHAKRFTKMAQDAVARGHLTSGELAVLRRPDRGGRPALACYWRQAAELLDGRTATAPKRPPQQELIPANREVEAS